MKIKPQSHRSTNTFRFEGFHARVKKLRVTPRDFILQKSKYDEDRVTFLWQTVCDWKEKNLTIGFQKFLDTLGIEFQTIAQLLLYEDHIANVIESHLGLADVLSLPPLLNSLVSFARDNPQSFYQKYFDKFVKLLSTIVVDNVKCHETVENVFVCYVSLFTLLQKYIANNFYQLYVEDDYCALLSKAYPWYINELSAQTLGNMLRKFPRRKEYFALILKRLKKNVSESKGVGCLLFHTLKSDVARRLHSLSKGILEEIFDLILHKEIPLEESREAIGIGIKQTLFHVTSNVSIATRWQETWKEDSKYLWPIFFEKLNAAIEDSNLSSEEEEKTSPLIVFLSLLADIVQFRFSALVTDFSLILEILISATKRPTNDEVGTQIASVASKLLISTHYDAPRSLLKSFLDSFFGSFFTHTVIFDFIDLVLDSKLFEEEILPPFLNFVYSLLIKEVKKSSTEETTKLEGEVTGRILASLSTIINSNVPPIRAASDLESWSEFPLDFSPSSPEESDDLASSDTPLKCLLESIFQHGLAQDYSNIENIMQCCFCLPHIRPLVKEDFIPYLFWILSDAREVIQSRKAVPLIVEQPEPKKKKRRLNFSSDIQFNTNLASDESTRKLIFLSSVIVETLYHLIQPDEFLTALVDHEPLSILMENTLYRENIHLLKIVDIYLTVLAAEKDTKLLTEDTLKKIYPIIVPSLASHKPLVRLLVSRIFSLFFLNQSSFDVKPEQTMFLTMFEVEAFAVSPLDYKERLRLMSNLDADRIQLPGGGSNIFREAPVLFLIGQLYINFKELWTPCVKMIAKYAHYLPEDVFWNLWLYQLKQASHFALRSLCEKEIEEESSTTFFDPTLDSLHKELIFHSGFSSLVSKPNYLHFRDLLWQTMQHFPEICERKNKDVVSIFMDFLYKEYLPVDYNVAPSQDISVFAETLDDDEENEQEINEEVHTSLEEELTAKQRSRKAPTSTLCEHLKILAKFHNPKVIFKSKELETIYLEFLSHPHLPAQKLALDALMTYNHKYIMPYQETLYNILDDKVFRNEITLFNIEGKGEDENKSLKEEHRKDFMPVLMRILFGKMLYKTGSHTAGKSNITARKAVVLRFLAGANEEELDTFLNLSFDVMLTHLEGNALEIVEKAEKNLDPKKVFPLKRMIGALGTLDVMFDKLGSLLERKRPFMLKVILLLLSISVNLLENREQVCSHFYPLLKSIRQMSMQRVVAFFSNYVNYNWSNDELEAVFRAAVWPSLDRLPIEGIHSPTPLLRLFICWADHSSYHNLLGRHHPENKALTPMPFLMKLINHLQCSKGVVETVYNIILKLLDPKQSDDEADEDESMPSQLPVRFVLPLQEEAEALGFQGLSYGESIVLSSMGDLLTNIKENLLGLRHGELIRNRDLTILIHLSQWITNKKDAQELIEAIVPLLRKSCVKQPERVAALLDTCIKLVGIIEEPRIFTKSFLRLFSAIGNRAARKNLCCVIETLYSSDEEKSQTIGRWPAMLNAWSESLVDELNFELRIEAYKEINRLLKETETFDEELIMFLIHQNIWTLNNVKDQVILSLAIACLENLFDMITRFNPDTTPIITQVFDQHLIPLIKVTLKKPAETIRNSIMTILRCAVHKCHEFSPKFQDLLPLANDRDLDGDFFTAIAHLQRSRRTRALIKLADKLNDGILHFKTETLVEFLLPIASVYLFKEEYATDANLLTACVVCIGAIAKKLPWFHYQNILRQYLNLVSRELSQLKLGVRVLEVVIDAFHENVAFDEDEIPGKPLEMPETPKESNEEQMDLDETSKTEDEKLPAASTPSKPRNLKVYHALTRDIIPQIQNVLAAKSLRDYEHKVNKKKYPEEEDIKRIPLALACIKLLKKLPKNVLEMNVSNVLMKLISFLKSKAESIRKESRAMLVKVMEELGGEYLPLLVNDFHTLLNRGYQVHVMVFSLHAILSALLPILSPSHIATPLKDMMKICMNDLFGDKAEERLVGLVSSKVKEVKANKGYDIMGILSEVVAVDQLELIMIPLREHLQTQDKVVVRKVARCLQRIQDGLEQNKNISIEHKSMFVYGLLKDKITDLAEKKKDKTKEKQKKLLERKDSFLLEPEPKRVGHMPKTFHKVTVHVLVEFALKLLYHLLKDGHFLSVDKKHLGLLDAYVAIMSDCLLSEYPEVSIQALHVISKLVQFQLPSLHQHLPKICGQMFIILNKFASSSLVKGVLFNLVQLNFKVLAQIIKEVSFCKFQDEQFKVLLFYARDNLENSSNHHSSFIILNAILHRKVDMQELSNFMEIVKEISIKSTNPTMLDQSRKSYSTYVLTYPRKKKFLVGCLYFFANNISYDIPDGRMSAGIMLHYLVRKLRRDIFDQSVEVTLWFKLSHQIATEMSKEHKSLLQRILTSLFIKSERKSLYIDNCMKLLSEDLMKSKTTNSTLIHMGAQSLYSLLDVPITELPASVFDTVIPKIVSLLHPSQYQLGEEEAEDLYKIKCLDLTLNSLLNLFKKLMDLYLNKDSLSKWNEHIGQNVWKFVKDHLLYPNLEVRLSCSSIIGKLFALYPVEEKESPSIASTPEETESLVIDLCEQLNTECEIESSRMTELGMAVVRNLVYLIRQSRKVPIRPDRQNPSSLSEADPVPATKEDKSLDVSDCTEKSNAHSSEDSLFFRGIYWVLQRVRVLAYIELRKKGKSCTFRRECLLNLIAGVVVVLGDEFETADSIISFIVSHITREQSDPKLPESLSDRTRQVADLLKEKIGVEKHSELTVRAKTSLDAKKTVRKAMTHETVMKNPSLASKMKAKKRAVKKEARKKKQRESKLVPSKRRDLRSMAFIQC